MYVFPLMKWKVYFLLNLQFILKLLPAVDAESDQS